MFRQALFQVHWLLGITVGLFLAVVGVTGAMMSFEEEIMAALNSRVSRVVEREAPRLTVPQLVERAYDHLPPGATLHGLFIEGDAERLPRVQYWLGKYKYYDERTQGERYVDPYDGSILSDPIGRNFFRNVRSIHRWFLLPDRIGGPGENEMGPGRWATMITSTSLIFFALSGLYLRWPRQPLDWWAWLKIDLKMTGRNLYRSLHAVIGGWVLVLYLLSAFTGLWWSFGEPWSPYRNAASLVLTGHDYKPGDGDGGFPLPRAFATAWAAFESTKPGAYEYVWVEVRDQGGPVRFRVMPPGGAHERAWNVVKVDGSTGAVLSQSRYGQSGGKPTAFGDAVISNVIVIHTGSYFGLPGRMMLMASSAALPLFAITGWLLYLGRREKKKALRAIQVADFAPAGDASLLIVHASQTKTAESVALQTATAFAKAGQAAHVVAIDKLEPEALARARTALFVVSTYGDGEPPDCARGFARRQLDSPAAFDELSYAVLALGDREYPLFCQFGHRIDQWLRDSGATRVFDTIEVNGSDDASIEAWRKAIARLGADAGAVKIEEATFARWRLVERTHLNAGGPGAPAFHVALECLERDVSWEAGDIAEIVAGAAPYAQPALIDADAMASVVEATPLQGRGAVSIAGAQLAAPAREYSIASIPETRRVAFIVRQVQKPDGQLGAGSGWLTHHAAIGDEVAMRIRPNPAFRAPDDTRAMILIGNGTGLAGLLAHIRQRAERDAAPMWLLFGERTRIHDRFHGDELDGYLATGVLARSDFAYSRDPGDGRYVQELIAEVGEEICRWVGQGAAIYVCGSLAGMAPAVDRRLREVLGDAPVDAMIDAGLYRRDVY
jgi:sulfite reductase (NADPH) flavoprotein alpha-component